MSAIAEIEKQVLALSIGQRVLLAEVILDSLPRAMEEFSEAAEIAEAERRDREIETGQVQPLSEADFWRRVDANRNR